MKAQIFGYNIDRSHKKKQNYFGEPVQVNLKKNESNFAYNFSKTKNIFPKKKKKTREFLNRRMLLDKQGCCHV